METIEKRIWQIYTLSDPRTQQVRYVGITFRGKLRYNEHLSRAMTGGKTHRDCWIRSLVWAGIRPEFQVIETGQGEGWQDAERAWIAKYRLSADLVNHTDGGDGTPGVHPTIEMRRRLSETRKGVPYRPGRVSAMKGKHHTVETREKIRVTSTGRIMPESQGRKISRARKGKLLSVAQKEKLRIAHLGKKMSDSQKKKIQESTKTRKPVQCVETGTEYASVKDVMRAFNVPHASVYQAIHKGCRCKGYHFRFL
jgi:hypothetical protein